MRFLKKAHTFLRSTPLLIMLGLSIVCTALYHQQHQKLRFKTAQDILQNLQTNVKSVEEARVFLSENHLQLNFLAQHGWLVPQSRLIAGAAINQWASELNKIHIKIEPEIIKDYEGRYSFKVSKIMIEAEALLDTSLYEFADKILKHFPGILVFRKLSVHRNFNKSDLTHPIQKNRPCLVTGEFIFEWVAMADHKDHKDRDF